MFEYRKAPEKTAAAYTRDGAFTVGDIGYVDEDGYLFISGRTADVIVSTRPASTKHRIGSPD